MHVQILSAGGIGTHVTRRIGLAANERLNLSSGRHDLFVLAGRLGLDGHDLAEGTYIGMDGVADFTAGPDGASLFHFQKEHAGLAARIIIEPHNRAWRPGIAPGIRRCDLRVADHQVAIVSFAPDTSIAPHRHPRGEEIYVLSGELHNAPMALGPGEWHRLYPSAIHAPHAVRQTGILLLTGHLAS